MRSCVGKLPGVHIFWTRFYSSDGTNKITPGKSQFLEKFLVDTSCIPTNATSSTKQGEKVPDGSATNVLKRNKFLDKRTFYVPCKIRKQSISDDPLASVIRPLPLTDNDIVINKDPYERTHGESGNYYILNPSDEDCEVITHKTYDLTSLSSELSELSAELTELNKYFSVNMKSVEQMANRTDLSLSKEDGILLTEILQSHREKHSVCMSEFERKMVEKVRDSDLPDLPNIVNVKSGDKLNYPIDENKDKGLPDKEKINLVADMLQETLPQIFTTALDYSLYHPDLIFINNIRGTVTMGLPTYVNQVLLMRTMTRTTYAHVHFNILKLTRHPEDGTVKIRWRIQGISALKVVLKFLKYKFRSPTDSDELDDTWYDGFSTFHVGSDGLVYKHVLDSRMPDSDRTVELPLSAKLAAMFGLSRANAPETCFQTSKRPYLMLPLEKLK